MRLLFIVDLAALNNLTSFSLSTFSYALPTSICSGRAENLHCATDLETNTGRTNRYFHPPNTKSKLMVIFSPFLSVGVFSAVWRIRIRLDKRIQIRLYQKSKKNNILKIGRNRNRKLHLNNMGERKKKKFF